MLIAVVASLVIAQPSSVPADRLATLSKGINLSHWWAQSFEGYTDEHLTTYITPRDFRLIRQMGFRHVRFTLEPMAIWNEADPAKLPPARLSLLKEDVKGLVDAGLGVIVDAHPSDEFKKRIETDLPHRRAFTAWWGSVAKEIAPISTNKVFFEPLNEPAIDNAQKWYAIQGDLLRTIRRAAPRHTIIVSGDRWSSADRLVLMKPYEDRNVVYNFHCYDPFIFTHQGATWGWDMTKWMTRLPYPSAPGDPSTMVKAGAPAEVTGHVNGYLNERWNRDRLRAHLAPVREWMKRTGRPVTCNEFGVYQAESNAADSLRWHEDLIAVLDEMKIGWTKWDYCGGFGVVSGEKGARQAKADYVRALRLGAGR